MDVIAAILIGLAFDLTCLGVTYRVFKWFPAVQSNDLSDVMVRSAFLSVRSDCSNRPYHYLANHGQASMTGYITRTHLLIRNTLLTFAVKIPLKDIETASMYPKLVNYSLALQVKGGCLFRIGLRREVVEEWKEALQQNGVMFQEVEASEG